MLQCQSNINLTKFLIPMPFYLFKILITKIIQYNIIFELDTAMNTRNQNLSLPLVWKLKNQIEKQMIRLVHGLCLCQQWSRLYCPTSGWDSPINFIPIIIIIVHPNLVLPACSPIDVFLLVDFVRVDLQENLHYSGASQIYFDAPN